MGFPALGKELEPLLEPLPVWVPRLEQGPCMAGRVPLRNHSKPLPCSQSVGAWGRMSFQWYPLLPLIPAMQPLSLPFLKPKSSCPPCFGGKSHYEALVGEDGDFYWQTSTISICHACRIQLQGLCLSTWLAPGCMSPSALARSPCPGEEDMGPPPVKASLPSWHCPQLGAQVLGWNTPFATQQRHWRWICLFIL